jgi:activator-of-BECN1-regulated-autophagy protein 1
MLPPSGLLEALLLRESGGPTRCVRADPQPCSGDVQVARSLESWAEADSLKHWSARYCVFRASPRSTIATAFSPDGALVASTQCVPCSCRSLVPFCRRCALGFDVLVARLVRPADSGDHTVKLCCCRTGLCVQTLTGHRRTPWVVRFHPLFLVLGAEN